MADDYDYDVDGYNMEDDWLYVEDDFPLADELAETQTADPGYGGTSWEIEMETYEYEFYEFWDDLEYANDDYWDYDHGPPPKQQDLGKMGQKRKRAAGAKTAPPDKRRKVSGKQADATQSSSTDPYPVLFMSVEEQMQIAWRRPPISELKPVSFFADWREKFPEHTNLPVVEMPKAMKLAAEAQDSDTPPKKRFVDADGVVEDGENEEWDEEDDGDEGAEKGDARDVLASLDPETLKMILRQKMGEAGLQGVDEGEFMETIGKMLAGGEGSDDAAGMLADSVLGKATQGEGDTELSSWLSQQGVSLVDAEEDIHDGTSVATEELPEGSAALLRSTSRGFHDSPPDSAIGVPRQQGSTSEMAVHSGFLASQRETTASKAKKSSGKKVDFADPPQTGGKKEEASKETNPQNLPSYAAPTRASRSKATNSKAAEQDRAASSGSKAEVEKDAAQEPAKPTCKRKAPASEPGDDVTSGSTAPQDIKEPATKRTRSVRAARSGA